MYDLDWFPLQYKGRKAGEIYLEMTFYAAVKKTFSQIPLLALVLINHLFLGTTT